MCPIVAHFEGSQDVVALDCSAFGVNQCICYSVHDFGAGGSAINIASLFNAVGAASLFAIVALFSVVCVYIAVSATSIG